MAVDETLSPPRLRVRSAREQIVRHFPTAFGVRIDPGDLAALPDRERLSLAGARLPEPPEAVLLDRVLQLVPVRLLEPVDRILIVDRGSTGTYGGFRAGIIRIYTPALRLTLPDPDYGRRFSFFTTTVL